MANESPEKEFNRYSLKSQKDKINDSRKVQLPKSKNFMWITAFILFIFTFLLGIIVGISITPKSSVYSQKNSVLSKHCYFFDW